MKKLLLAVFLLLPTAVCVQAAQDLKPNWGLNDITGQNRTVTDSSNQNNPLAIVGAGSLEDGSVTNSSLTIDGVSVSINSQTAADQAYAPTSATQGAYVAGGAVFNNTAAGNTLNISNTTLTGRDAYGGAANLKYTADRFGAGSANNNVVNINNVTTNAYTFTPSAGGGSVNLGGNVYGGYSKYAKGTANGNTVNVSNGSTINGNVYGGVIDDILTEEDLKTAGVLDSYADNNTVVVTGSTVNGTVAGAAGASSSSNNTVLVTDSEVTSVFGVDQSRGVADSDTSVTYANNNTVTIKGSNVTNAAAVNTTSINASGNTLNLEDSTIGTGAVYAVNMGLNRSAVTGNPVAATVGSNTLNLSKMTGTFSEMGASLNLVGTSSNNVLTTKDSTLTLTNNTGNFFGGTLDITSLSDHDLLQNLDTSKGYLFGGASMTYTSQTGTGTEAPEAKQIAIGGTNSDNNALAFSGGSVTANIFGGFTAYIDEIDYTVTGEDGSTTTTVKNGLTVTTTSSAPDAEPTEPEVREQIDDVYSASNNTIVLDNVNFSGNIYGGYVYGAELKEENMLTQNNTVILRGNVSLDPASVIYGGSNAYYASTNHLVFDRVQATFSDAGQFQNFNQMWNINANFETDLNFEFDGVYASMTLDKSAMKEDSAAVVTTQTTNDLSNIQQGDKVYDLTDSGIVLAQNKVGAYSFDLTGVKGSANNEVDWVLTSTKDKANVEMYGQLPLVGLALISDGPEMLTQTMHDIWQSDTEQNTFLNGAYHNLRYKTGSGFDLNSGLVQAGAWKKFTDNWVLGFFAKYANGSYETFPIKVSGDANAFGGGLMTSLRYSDTGRLELNAEVGYMDMDFNSNELLSAFSSNGLYYGASAGFVENLLQDLDLFANIQWYRKANEDISDNLGQKIQFSALQSLALRFGADYMFRSLDLGGLTPAVGVSGLYEFDGDSTVSVDGMSNSDASMKGMSGRGEFSLVYHNNDTFLPLHTVMTVFGQIGKREGFGGEVNISFEF